MKYHLPFQVKNVFLHFYIVPRNPEIICKRDGVIFGSAYSILPFYLILKLLYKGQTLKEKNSTLMGCNSNKKEHSR